MSSAPSSPSPLFIPELFYAVLDFLAEPTLPSVDGFPFRTPDPGSQRALAVLARTCRGFTRPALDLLWRRLSSLEPLLWCFIPMEGVFARRRDLRPPSPADWVVIKRYACRIQQLEVRNDCSPFFLKCATFEVGLFPNLKALKWSSQSTINRISISLIQPLLGPGITVLDVCGSELDVAFASFLGACPSRCPSVTAVRICVVVQMQVELIDIYSRALGSFKNLKSLHVEPFVNDDVLQHLLMSAKLQKLCLYIRLDQLREFSPPPSVIPLRNIQTLDLRLARLRLLTELLRPGDQRFCGVLLYLLNLEFAALIGSLFTGLASHPEKSSLQLLHVRGPRSHSFKDPELFILSSDTFRPLTCHTNLRQLIIDLANPISLSDKELADLARNWPLLQLVEFCYAPQPPHGAKRVTFKGLLSLVPICPKLRRVALTLDGREVPSGVAVGSCSKTITRLRFPNSPIDNQTRLVAKFLLAHFPSVTSVSDTEAFPSRRRGGEWAQVEEYIADPSKLESTTGE